MPKYFLKYRFNLKPGFIPVVIFLCFAFKYSTKWTTINKDDAAKELLEMGKKINEIKIYSFHVTYKSYEGHDLTIPHQTMEGFLIKSGINSFNYLGETYTIQNKKLRVIIDSVKKVIKVTDPMEDVEGKANINDYIKSMEFCKEIKKSLDNSIVAYRLENKAKRGIVAHEIYLEGLFVKESTLFYANDISKRVNNETKRETVYPKLQILFSDFKSLKKVDIEIFNTDKFVIIKNGQIVLNDNYKKFKLIDGRFK